MSGSTRKSGVQPSVLNQFFDKPPSSQRRPRGNQERGAPISGFGASKRASLTDQRALKTPSEDGGLGGAFGRADYKNDINLPRTEAQKVLQRAVDDRAEDEIYVVVPEKYTIAGVVPPTNKKLKIPKVENEYLMSPQQRRELAQFELKKQEAVKLQRKAKGDKDRMIDLMRTQYPNGVIGMDQVEPKYGERISNVYADKVDASKRSYARAVAAQEERKKNIVANSDSLQRRGYSFIHQTGDAPIQKSIAGRRGKGVQPSNDTHSRLFAREEYKHNPVRAEALRQQDMRGRQYDILTGIRR